MTPKPTHGDPAATTTASGGSVPVPLSERQWQQQVLDLATLYRWGYYHTFDSRRSQPGFPDLVLWRERVVYAELKATTGRLTALQKHVIEGLRQAGQRVFVWRPEDLDAVKVELAWRDGDGFATARNVAVKGERL